MWTEPKLESMQGLMLTARTLVDGVYAGSHVSPRRGQGGEFYDFRPYAAGDDPAKIDWKRFARTERYYLRRYEHQAQLTAMVCVDVSASMGFAEPTAGQAGAGGMSKLDYARQLAAALAMLLVRQRDRVGLVTFSDAVHASLQTAGSYGHLRQVVETLEATRASEGAADFERGLGAAGGGRGRAGLVVVVSDLLDPPGSLFRALSSIRAGGADVLLLQILTPTETDLRALGGGFAQLIDPETGRSASVNVERRRQAYRRAIDEHQRMIRETASRHGVDHHLLLTDVPPLAALRKVLTMRVNGGAVR